MEEPGKSNLPELSSKEETLKNFMLEMFDFDGLKKFGVYGKEIKRKDYQAQADRICKYFGYQTVFEYGSKEVRCHLSVQNPQPEDKFVIVIPNIYEQ